MFKALGSNRSRCRRILCHVINDVTLICALLDANNGSAMTNTLTGGTLLCRHYGTYWPLADITDCVKAVGCTEYWFNMPITMDITRKTKEKIFSFMTGYL